VYERLRAEGYDVWFDREHMPPDTPPGQAARTDGNVNPRSTSPPPGCATIEYRWADG
jgi:hypothetical protein